MDQEAIRDKNYVLNYLEKYYSIVLIKNKWVVYFKNSEKEINVNELLIELDKIFGLPSSLIWAAFNQWFIPIKQAFIIEFESQMSKFSLKLSNIGWDIVDENGIIYDFKKLSETLIGYDKETIIGLINDWYQEEQIRISEKNFRQLF